jgi:hypothetical protein
VRGIESVTPITWIILAVVYLGIGFGLMLWINHDNEFREMPGGDILAYGSVFLWPIFAPIYYFLRPPEQLEDLASKKTYQDFKNFMRERGRLDSGLLSKLEATKPDEPYEIGGELKDEFRDYHLEELINDGEWMEALRTANDMLRFAREQQEHTRVMAYERYIKEIKDRRREEMA